MTVEIIDADKILNPEKYRVNFANELACADVMRHTNKLSSSTFKIILGVIGRISPNDEDFKEYDISVEAISKLTGIKELELYKHLKKWCQEIHASPITIETEVKGGKDFVVTNWFIHSKYCHGQSRIKFCVSPDLKVLLLDLKRNYTSFQLGHIQKLKSVYAIRLYIMLRRVLPIAKNSGALGDQKQLIVPLSELHKYLGTDETKSYQRIERFKEKVLNPAMEELEELTDICFAYEGKRSGRFIRKMEFTVTHNPKNIQDFEPDQEYIQADSSEDKKTAVIMECMKIIPALEPMADQMKELDIDKIRHALMSTVAAKIEGRIKGSQTSYFISILFNSNDTPMGKSKPKTTEEKLTDRSWDEEHNYGELQKAG